MYGGNKMNGFGYPSTFRSRFVLFKVCANKRKYKKVKQFT